MDEFEKKIEQRIEQIKKEDEIMLKRNQEIQKKYGFLALQQAENILPLKPASDAGQ